MIHLVLREERKGWFASATDDCALGVALNFAFFQSIAFAIASQD